MTASDFTKEFPKRFDFLLLQESFRAKPNHFMLEGCFIFMGEPIANPIRIRLPISIVVTPQHVRNIRHDTFVQKGCAIDVSVNVDDETLFLVSASLDPYSNFEDYEKSDFDAKYVLSNAPRIHFSSLV